LLRVSSHDVAVERVREKDNRDEMIDEMTTQI